MISLNYKDIEKELKKLSSDTKADASRWFFKTGPGEYGEGDEFIGVKVPDQRKVAKKYKDLEIKEVQKLLDSMVHEHRLTALFILVSQFERAKDEVTKAAVYKMYLKNVRKGNVNNWDLVDSSAHKIVGAYLLDRDRGRLYELADSDNLWEQRVAIISTYRFIKNDQFGDTLLLSEKLLGHEHDLIHKAVGWMLREVGKRDFPTLEEFLLSPRNSDLSEAQGEDEKRSKSYKRYGARVSEFSTLQNDKRSRGVSSSTRKQSASVGAARYKEMPRTMLRYAIEKFPEGTRQRYLKGEI